MISNKNLLITYLHQSKLRKEEEEENILSRNSIERRDIRFEK
jgi:hypothetical protein